MMLLGLATAITIQSEESWLIPSYWLLASPLPYLAGFPYLKTLDVVPELRPINIKPLLLGMERFLRPVQSEHRIIMAFENPQGEFHKVFDRFKNHNMLLSYVEKKKNILIIPSQEAVYEANYPGAPDFWGREVNQVLNNIKNWKADYVIIYQENDSLLDHKWSNAGFQTLAEFDWESYSAYLGENHMPKPKWWLLSPPTKNLRS